VFLLRIKPYPFSVMGNRKYYELETHNIRTRRACQSYIIIMYNFIPILLINNILPRYESAGVGGALFSPIIFGKYFGTLDGILFGFLFAFYK